MKFICKCFYTSNIFLHSIKRHVTYVDDEKLFDQISKDKASLKDEEWKLILSEVHGEIERRKKLGLLSAERSKVIKEKYKPLYPDIYNLQESFLCKEFLDLVGYCKTSAADLNGLMSLIEKTKAEKVYSFPVLTKDFCKLLLEELSHFENSDLPKGRPNTMNRYGVLLDELGFKDFMDCLRDRYLQPITTILYPDTGGNSLDSHRAFTVKYKEGEDVDLNFHFDNAEITLNISLNSDFDEGSLYFGNMRTEPTYPEDCLECKHRLGYGLLHRGQHMHGALPISDGERWNLILWMRSSNIRNNLCPMCNKTPDLEPTPGFGDGFTKL